MGAKVRISGLMLDAHGYQVSPPVASLEAHVLADGSLWEDWYGEPFERITLRGGDLVVCGGTFIPDEGEMSRLSRDHGCTL